MTERLSVILDNCPGMLVHDRKEEREGTQQHGHSTVPSVFLHVGILGTHACPPQATEAGT